MISGLVTLSQLAMDFPILQELDINPFMACPKGMRSCAIDARLGLSD
ncbi:MAG: acetate--CoA ligase family protein [Chloroflexi bacterium]|nr:acetate--CoA ligase family protein [Chloroflexota bacterium]